MQHTGPGIAIYLHDASNVWRAQTILLAVDNAFGAFEIFIAHENYDGLTISQNECYSRIVLADILRCNGRAELPTGKVQDYGVGGVVRNSGNAIPVAHAEFSSQQVCCLVDTNVKVAVGKFSPVAIRVVSNQENFIRAFLIAQFEQICHVKVGYKVLRGGTSPIRACRSDIFLRLLV